MSARGGRPPNRLIIQNFREAGHVENRSHRKYYICKHCHPDDDSSEHAIEHRDNRLLQHLSDHAKCPNAPDNVRQDALKSLMDKNGITEASQPFAEKAATPMESGEAQESVTVRPVKKRRATNLDGYVDHAMSKLAKDEANMKLLRYLIYTNSTFSHSEDAYFLEFVHAIWPSYTPSSRYVLSHTVMDAEYARVQVQELKRLKSRTELTLLMDGWEDLRRRSLYGTVAAGVNKFPQVLALEDLTGQRATAKRLLDVAKLSMQRNEVGDENNFIACTTDNPTTMQASCRIYQQDFWWILVFWCFLHKVNTIIGHIVGYRAIKVVISQTTCIVTFFNSSHYWGGQLDEQAK